MGRLHTENGQFVGFGKSFNALRSFCQAVNRKVTGYIPRQPWIPFSAAVELNNIIKPDWIVHEVGAGYSTLWLSDRAKKVVSIEASKEWFDRLSIILKEESNSNVDLRYEWQADRMSDFSEVPDESLDLLFIDGGPRGECLANGFPKVKAGGYLYLDNWDNESFWQEQYDFFDRLDPKSIIVKSFVDYVPAQVGVYLGLLVRKSPE